jgi:L-ascorbate metabolism protein UlaG (beta-lactamase superfamily)
VESWPGGAPSSVRVTWWGHSTVSIEDDGVRLLTDPVLGHRVGHLRRRRGPAPSVTGAPDAVLISHLHADHLHLASLCRIAPTTTVVLPAGALSFVRRTLGARAAHHYVELDVGDETHIGGVCLRAVPAAHDGGRGPWSRHRAVAVGYTIHGTANTWFAGDTGLFPGMHDLGPLDLALVPVGGWGPTLGRGHLDPSAAAEAVRRAEPAYAVPVHFGTFWPVGFDRVRPDRFYGPGDEFARQAGAVAPRTQVRVLVPGESVALLPPRMPS